MDFRRQPKNKRVTPKVTNFADFKKRVAQAEQVDGNARLRRANQLSIVNPKVASTSASGLTKKPQTQSLSDRVDTAEKVVADHTKTHFFERIANLYAVRKIVFVLLLLMGSLLLAIGLAQYFNQSRYEQEVFGQGGTYSEGIVGEINSLNPIFAASEPERAFSRLAFSRLLTIDSSGKLNGDLARNFETDNDYRKYTFEITQDAKWSDGKNLTVDDIIFTMGLLADNSVNPVGHESWSKVKITKQDNYNFSFELPNGSRNFVYGLDFAILPKHKLENVAPNALREDKFSEEPTTSGIFGLRTFQTVEERKTIFLVANKEYYSGAPKLDRFEIRSFQDEESLTSALKSGEILAASNVSIAEFSDGEKKLFGENKTDLKRGLFAFLNQSNAVLKDPKVRQAIQKGMNVAKTREQLDGMTALDYPILGQYFDSSKVPAISYNQAEAKKILDDSGWKLQEDGVRQKGDLRLTLDIVTIKNTDLETVAKSFESQLKERGFEVNLRVVDPNDRTQNFVQAVLMQREYGILISEISLGVDPELYAFWHSSQATESGFNLSNYRGGVSDDNIVSSMNLEDGELRRAKYESFVSRWTESVPAIGIVQSRSSYAYKNSVKPYDSANKFVENVDRYADAQYWQVNKAEVYKTP